MYKGWVLYASIVLDCPSQYAINCLNAHLLIPYMDNIHQVLIHDILSGSAKIGPVKEGILAFIFTYYFYFTISLSS